MMQAENTEHGNPSLSLGGVSEKFKNPMSDKTIVYIDG
jgi:hypothetical protein